ncbi:MAG TPA: type VII secretion protein EssB, partial [Lactococcus sp.]|nr:type VII secretion protein EssB [Lactococcus sp.]
SSIHLADLSQTQKAAILNNISSTTDDNTLNYWIYQGRGEFEKSLNLAKNIGDDQLTLLAYTDLYQVTKLNSTMNGDEKQKKLEEYNKAIQELSKSLGK